MGVGFNPDTRSVKLAAQGEQRMNPATRRFLRDLALVLGLSVVVAAVAGAILVYLLR